MNVWMWYLVTTRARCGFQKFFGWSFVGPIVADTVESLFSSWCCCRNTRCQTNGTRLQVVGAFRSEKSHSTRLQLGVRRDGKLLKVFSQYLTTSGRSCKRRGMCMMFLWTTKWRFSGGSLEL
jgi:hypothetical protein